MLGEIDNAKPIPAFRMSGEIDNVKTIPAFRMSDKIDNAKQYLHSECILLDVLDREVGVTSDQG